MDMKDIATPSRTKALLNHYGFSFKKSLGQNFLIDVNIIHNIIDASNIDERTGVIEVGPGMGSLTEQLAKSAKKVIAFEIDQRLIPVLNETMAPYKNVTVINEDILKADIAHYVTHELADCEQILVVANLPYYITTPIIMKLLEDKLDIDSIVVMIQKEVAERLIETPGGKNTGAITHTIFYYCESEKVMEVPNSSFIPEPEVTSEVIKMKLRKKPAVELDNPKVMFMIIKSAFMQRRKTLLNSLTNAQVFTNKQEGLEILKKLNLEENVRAENLKLEDYANIAREIEK